MAIIYSGLGEKERAVEQLETGFGRGELPLAAIGVHPAYDALRDESRFKALVKKIGVG
jgi:hypothetical protein